MRESKVREEGPERQAAREVLQRVLWRGRTPAEVSAPDEAARGEGSESFVNPTIAKNLRFLCSKEFGGETGQYPANLYRRVKQAYTEQPRGQKNAVKAVLKVSEEIRVTRTKGRGWVQPPAKPSTVSRKRRRKMGL